MKIKIIYIYIYIYIYLNSLSVYILKKVYLKNYTYKFYFQEKLS